MGGTAERVISNLVNRTKGLDEIHDDVATIDGIVDVPTADVADNVQMADVVGNKTDAAVAVVGTTKTIVAYIKGVMNDLNNGTDGLGALKALIDTATTNIGTVDTVVDGIQTDLSNATDGLGALKALVYSAEQTKITSITAAANAASDTTLATVATGGVLVRGVVIHADAAQTADLTSCPVMGGAGKAITIIAAADALAADFNAENKQVSWTGEIYLPVGATIVMVHNGTGATALDLTVSIRYKPTVLGGTL